MKRVCRKLLMQQVAPMLSSPLQLAYDIQINLYYMKGKLPIKKKQLRPHEEEQQVIKQPRSEEEQRVQQDQNFIPRMLKKQTLYVTFTGTLETGFLPEEDSLTAFCTVMHGPDWIKVAGHKTFISQIAASNGQDITWNLPFQISFQTNYLTGWPQLVVALYGTDFFGRSFVRGYGNLHLPSQTGKHRRKVRVFRPLPQSTISGIFGFIGGVLAEYKDAEKLLSSGEGREVTRVKSMGELTVLIQTVKHNFKKYGYE